MVTKESRFTWLVLLIQTSDYKFGPIKNIFVSGPPGDKKKVTRAAAKNLFAKFQSEN